MKFANLIFFLLYYNICFSQQIDEKKYSIKVETSEVVDSFFKNDPIWRGADGASSIELENGKILWLFSDSFI